MTRHEPTCEETLEVIFDSAAKIAREHNFERLLDLIAEMGTRLIRCDRCTIWLLDKREGELWTKVALGMQTIRIPRNKGIVGEAVRTAKAIIINDPYNDARFHRLVDQETGYKTDSLLVIPMIGIDGQVIGAFQAVNKLDKTGFNPTDVERLQLAATFSAKILDAEHLLRANHYLQEEQKKAALKQQSIITNDFAADERFCVRVFSQGSETLSGDTYSLYKTQNGGALIYCVDGMGHGILPSLTSFSVASTIRQYIHETGSLEALASELLKTLRGILSEEEQLSCAFFWLSSDQATLDYFVAGFYPPLVQDDGTVLEISANNPPLMNFTQRVFVDRIELKRFEKLLIYSDGLVEDSLFHFSRNKAKSLLDPGLLDRVLSAVSMDKMDDDVTVVYFAASGTQR